jgi:hypothetical protein
MRHPGRGGERFHFLDCGKPAFSAKWITETVLKWREGTEHMPACDQCGKPAIVMRGGHPLCVSCNLKFEQAFEMQQRAYKEQINFLLDQADAITGVSAGFPRYDVSQPMVHTGPMTFHSIRVDRSVVGAVNTGTVKLMEVALNNVHIQNENAELETALKEFTEAVIHEATLSPETKNETIQQLTALTEQLAQPAPSRSMGVIKAFIIGIAADIATSPLVAHWDKIKHLLGL